MSAGPRESRVEQRDRLLLAMLPHVLFDGWSERALAAGAADAGWGPVMAVELFPDGLRGVTVHFNDWADRMMLQAVASTDLAGLPVRERVALLIRRRLEVLASYREAVRKAIAHLALPGHAGTAATCTYRTVDTVWHAAGDTATDFNFYTKRGLLGAVYGATVLYWLADESDDFAASWEFLDRRIADVMTIPRLQGRLRDAAGHLPSPFRLFRPFFAR